MLLYNEIGAVVSTVSAYACKALSDQAGEVHLMACSIFSMHSTAINRSALALRTVHLQERLALRCQQAGPSLARAAAADSPEDRLLAGCSLLHWLCPPRQHICLRAIA